MSGRYCASTPADLERDWGLALHGSWGGEIEPGAMAPIVRRFGAGAAAQREAVLARCGIETAAAGAKSARLAEVTAESIGDEAAPLSAAVARAQWCIVPAQSMLVWRIASAGAPPQRWRIRRRDRSPFGIAGVWQRSGDALGFALINIACDLHPLLAQFAAAGERPGPANEQRTPVLLAEEDYDAWLDASPARAALYFGTFGKDDLDAEPVGAAGATGAARL